MTQANKKFQHLKRQVHKWKSRDFIRDNPKDIPDINITTSEVKCKACDFKARYKFVRCPICNTLQ